MAIGTTITVVLNTQQKLATSSWGPTTTANIPVGNFAFVAIAMDNIATTTGQSSTVTSVVVGGQTFDKIGEYNNGTSANTGATISLWGRKITTQINSGSQALVSWSGGDSTAKGMVGGYFAFDTTKDVGILGPSFNSGSGTPGFIALGGNAPSDAMFLGVAAVESNNQACVSTSSTGASVLSSGSAFTTGGGAAANMACGGFYERNSSGTEQDLVQASGATGDNATIKVGIYEITVAPDFKQEAFRWYGNGLSETGLTAVAAQNVNMDLASGSVNRHLRIRVKGTGVAGDATDDYQLKVSYNGGAYADLPSSGVVAYADLSLTDGGGTTEQLTGGTGAWLTGQISEDGLVSNFDLNINDYTEFLFAIAVGEGAANDTYDFRVYRNGSPLETYTVTPRLTFVPIIGTLTTTLAAATASGAGVLPIVGASTTTLAAATTTSAGVLPIVGTGTSTLAPATVSATGGLPPNVGTLTTTLSAATGTGVGALTIAGVSTRTLSAATTVSTSTLAIVGVSTSTLSAATTTSAGTLTIAGVSTSTLSAATTTSAGALTIQGIGGGNLNPATTTSSAALSIQASGTSTLQGPTYTLTGSIFDPITTPAIRTISIDSSLSRVVSLEIIERLISVEPSLSRTLTLDVPVIRAVTLDAKLSRTITLDVPLSRQVTLE